jgi:hypothetical protein
LAGILIIIKMGLKTLLSSLIVMLSFQNTLVSGETVNADVLATSGQGSNILGAIDFLWGSGVA